MLFAAGGGAVRPSSTKLVLKRTKEKNDSREGLAERLLCGMFQKYLGLLQVVGKRDCFLVLGKLYYPITGRGQKR